MAPTLAWSTRSSLTTRRRAAAARSATSGSGLRCSDASAPRWTRYPVRRSATASGTTYTGAAPDGRGRRVPEPALRQQDRTDRVAGRHGAGDHLGAFGDEKTVLGLQVSPQVHVG